MSSASEGCSAGHWKSVTHTEFETLVERALRTLPRPFKEKIANVAIVVEDWADEETLRELGIEPPDTIGHYFGLDDDTMEDIEQGQ